MDERRLELKIGVLVLAAILGVAALLLLTGELRFGARAHFSVNFSHSGSVVEGAPVRLAGVPVGRVAEVKLLPDRRDERGRPLPVEVVLSIAPGAFATLSTDVEATVATQGPLGEPYIELTPGGAQAPRLAEGQTIRGNDPVRLEVLIARAGALLDALGSEEDIAALVASLSSVGRLAGRIDALLAEEHEDLRELIPALAATVKDLRHVAGALRGTLGPNGDATRLLANGAALSRLLKERAPGMSEDAARALEGLAALTSQLDEKDGEQVKATLARIAQAAASFEQLALRGERVLAEIEAGQGTLGALQNDATLYEELRALVTDLRKHPWKVLWKD